MLLGNFVVTEGLFSNARALTFHHYVVGSSSTRVGARIPLDRDVANLAAL